MALNEAPGDFDAQALFAALDVQRAERGLGWRQVAHQVWEMSAVLNERRPHDHPLAPGTITNIAEFGDTSCHTAIADAVRDLA